MYIYSIYVYTVFYIQYQLKVWTHEWEVSKLLTGTVLKYKERISADISISAFFTP